MDQHITDFMKLDDDFELFIKDFVNTFVKWELVQFFHNHQESSFSLEDLSQKLNRSAKTLKSEMEELVEKGFLITGEGKETTYRLLDPKSIRYPEIIGLLDRFIEFCKSREGRLRVIYKILKDGNPLHD